MEIMEKQGGKWGEGGKPMRYHATMRRILQYCIRNVSSRRFDRRCCVCRCAVTYDAKLPFYSDVRLFFISNETRMDLAIRAGNPTLRTYRAGKMCYGHSLRRSSTWKQPGK